jgi:TM2 domain-containing membrane protein YozV
MNYILSNLGTIFFIVVILGVVSVIISMITPGKSKSIAYLLWLIGGFGVLGFHRFYLWKIGTGFLWLFTGGLFGLGALIDLFTLGGKVDLYNTNVQLKEVSKATISNNTLIQETSINTKKENIENNKNVAIDNSNVLTQLTQLHDLKEKNVISNEIYEQERNKLLAKITPSLNAEPDIDTSYSGSINDTENDKKLKLIDFENKWTIGVILGVALLCGYGYFQLSKNNQSESNSIESNINSSIPIVNSNSSENNNAITNITKFIQFEDERNFEGISSLFAEHINRYWDLNYPTITELNSRYNHLWNKRKYSKNEIINISEIEPKKYKAEVKYTFTNNKDETKTVNSVVWFILNENDKIIETYGG